MSITVQIIGAPIACKDGVKDSWRKTAQWVDRKLKDRFNEAVEVCYFDLFDADCPPIPASAQLPLVIVAGEVVSSGGKISVPQIRQKIEAALTPENS